MFGMVEQILGYFTRMVGTRVDVSDINGSLHAKTNYISERTYYWKHTTAGVLSGSIGNIGSTSETTLFSANGAGFITKFDYSAKEPTTGLTTNVTFRLYLDNVKVFERVVAAGNTTLTFDFVSLMWRFNSNVKLTVQSAAAGPVISGNGYVFYD